MTITVNNIWYVNYGNGSSTGYFALTKWATGTAYTVGQIRRQNAAPAVGSERCFVCIVAGTSHATTEPTWTLTKGAKTTDNTVTWQECTGLPALNNDIASTPLSSANRSGAQVLGNLIQNNAATYYFICTTAGSTGAGEPSYVTTAGSTTVDSGCTWTCLGAVGGFVTAWGAPHARIIAAGANNWAVAGDSIYVSSAHAETVGASVAWSIQSANSGTAQTNIVCVDTAGHFPPQSGDIRTSATFTVTGNFAFTLTAGNLYVYGIIFNLQSSGNNNQANTITSGTGGGTQKFEACAFNLLSSANSSLSVNVAAGGSCEWINTTLQFGNTSTAFNVRGRFVWRDTASAFSGSVPTNVMMTDGVNVANIYFDGVDLNSVGASKIVTMTGVGSRFLAANCKLSASMVAPVASSAVNDDIRIDYLNCDSGAITVRCEGYSSELTQTTETTLIHTGGASDGTTGYSWKCAASTSAKWTNPGACFPIAIWNSTTGSSKTVSVEAIYNAAAVLNNDQLWIDVQYLGTASSTLASLATSTKANILATAASISASSVAWDSLLTARANSHANVIGDIISVSSNSGRAFFCTTGGTTSGSLPGAYASCVDGGSVTDGTAIFRAAVRMTVSVAVTPQMAGLIRATPKIGLASASGLYIDPLLTVT